MENVGGNTIGILSDNQSAIKGIRALKTASMVVPDGQKPQHKLITSEQVEFIWLTAHCNFHIVISKQKGRLASEGPTKI